MARHCSLPRERVHAPHEMSAKLKLVIWGASCAAAVEKCTAQSAETPRYVHFIQCPPFTARPSYHAVRWVRGPAIAFDPVRKSAFAVLRRPRPEASVARTDPCF